MVHEVRRAGVRFRLTTVIAADARRAARGAPTRAAPARALPTPSTPAGHGAAGSPGSRGAARSVRRSHCGFTAAPRARASVRVRRAPGRTVAAGARCARVGTGVGARRRRFRVRTTRAGERGESDDQREKAVHGKDLNMEQATENTNVKCVGISMPLRGLTMTVPACSRSALRAPGGPPASRPPGALRRPNDTEPAADRVVAVHPWEIRRADAPISVVARDVPLRDDGLDVCLRGIGSS